MIRPQAEILTSLLIVAFVYHDHQIRQRKTVAGLITVRQIYLKELPRVNIRLNSDVEQVSVTQS